MYERKSQKVSPCQKWLVYQVYPFDLSCADAQNMLPLRILYILKGTFSSGVD